jgi:hypothetical protein
VDASLRVRLKNTSFACRTREKDWERGCFGSRVGGQLGISVFHLVPSSTPMPMGNRQSGLLVELIKITGSKPSHPSPARLLSNKGSDRFLANCSALLAITGYIVQFVGFRALHWSVTVVQLGVTLIITAIRSWVRRGLGEHPIAIPAEQGHELAWLALLLMDEGQLRNSASHRPKLEHYWQMIYSTMKIGSSTYDLRHSLRHNLVFRYYLLCAQLW